MIGYVYLTYNDVNDILYIGKRQKPRYEKGYRGSGKHLKLAIAKYGKDKFHTVILERCETVEQLCDAEIRWIDRCRRKGHELYNIADGGCGGNMIDWSALSAERRKEINDKNRASHMGELNPFFGKRHTEETKAKIKRSSKINARYPHELMRYKNNQRAHLPRVAQIDRVTGEIIKVWSNWCEAGRFVRPTMRCGYSHISECCAGKKKSAYGYRWEVVVSEVTV